MKLKKFARTLDGKIYTDISIRLMYATDASVYREIPLAVAVPKNDNDIKKLIKFAKEEHTSLIFRTAGTSLAGQCVGSGIVVDVSKHFNKIIELNTKEHWVKVQPGVILSELNKHIQAYGLFFGPETSTANRCMIGGMLGNNSCGLHSLVYGSVRDHVLETKVILSDCSEAVFKSLSNEEFQEKCKGDKLENKIYKKLNEILSDTENQEEIRNEYPLKTIKRRNTGYALDILLDTSPFTSGMDGFNLSKLMAGSEGTLAFTSEIKLNLVPLPPKERALVCVHLNSLEEILYANLIALKHKPVSVELMDKTILDLTKANIEQQKNRFFLKDDPKAILIVEFAAETKSEIEALCKAMEKEMKESGYGFYFPVIWGKDIERVWDLRKSGLGVLSNMPGDAKPIAVIEDTAVDVNVLPEYIKELKQIVSDMNLMCVYFAHIGTGEIHIRPVINLKTEEGNRQFREVSEKISSLVKKYKGSYSGEHGDGRLRGEFIKKIIGDKNYRHLKTIKETFDADYIFNPGKIIDTPPMNTSLRYKPGHTIREINTAFDFTDTLGILRAIEKCNGSADCRKTVASAGGIMCPVYMATKDEKNSTRAKANILREFITNSTKSNPFNHKELFEVMDLCLSCKGCKSECPSNVDMAVLKAEFLHQYYKSNIASVRTRLFAYITTINKIFSGIHRVYNFFVRNKFASSILKSIFRIAPKRFMPLLSKHTLRQWWKSNIVEIENPIGSVNLFCDEFTDYNDVEIGIKAIKLLNKLGYKVNIPEHKESGRTFISKGFIKKAKKLANNNVSLLQNVVTSNMPLIGIEPSAILTFRDEYPKLVDESMREIAKELANNCLMIDEFLIKEIENGNINSKQFEKAEKKILVHGHCHQKSLASIEPTKKMLSLPEEYEVEVIPSGCCGMAGAFGYEKEHYDVSMKIGELVLFPSIRNVSANTIIAAPGTSCRQHIKDGTGRKAYHPVEILYEAFVN